MKNKKGNMAVIAIIIIIVAITAGFLGWIFAKKSQAPAGSQNQAVAIQSNNVNSADIPTDWKTYANAKYGFEIKYPRKITFISEPEDKLGNNIRIRLNITTQEKGYETFPLLDIFIYSENDFNNLMKNDYFSSKFKAGVSKSINANGKVYTLGFGFQDGPKEWMDFVLGSEYKEMLSTFKFTK